MNKIIETDKTSKFISDILFVFSYFLSGTILTNPCYIVKNPFFAFAFLFIMYIVFAIIMVKCLKRDKVAKNSVLALVIFVISVFVLLVYLNEYIGNFDGFFDYEQNFFALITAAIVGIACAFCGAKSGLLSVTGFVSITALGLVLWRIMGLFGFFTTKKLMPLDFSFDIFPLSSKQFFDAVKVLIITVCDFYVLYRFFHAGSNEGCEKNGETGKSIIAGVLAFLGFEYINTVKNMSLFGKEVLPEISNPDLASVRLFPFLELPEIGVIVFMFALITKFSVYFSFFAHLFKNFAKNRQVKTK